MFLRLEKKQLKKEAKLKDFGTSDEMEPGFFDSFSTQPVQFPSPQPFVIPTNGGATTKVNGNTKIHVERLFGASKPFGLLPSKPRKQRFSHSRVFGSRKNVDKQVSS